MKKTTKNSRCYSLFVTRLFVIRLSSFVLGASVLPEKPNLQKIRCHNIAKYYQQNYLHCRIGRA